ncbi:MAG: hypothetical protein RIR25_839 [Verrucomicrobiota bacterium]|jgi:hypothetical protein
MNRVSSYRAMSALVFLAVMAATHVCPGQSNNLVAVDPIILRTKTPLGDASIILPAGAPLKTFEVQGENIKVWQGPFTAVVPRAGAVAPPAETATPENAPTSAQAIAASAPPPLPVATMPPPPAAPAPRTATAADAASSLLQVLTMENWKTWAMPAAVGALAAYALFSTVAWIGLRRRKSAPAAGAAHLPVIIMPKKTAQPAEVKEGGRAIACPLCSTGIPFEKLTGGRNACPSCHGDFVCE